MTEKSLVEAVSVDRNNEMGIATIANNIIQQFKAILTKSDIEEDISADDPHLTSLNDLLQRYRLWAWSQGALHDDADRRSLDHKLRYTPLVVNAIKEHSKELEGLPDDLDEKRPSQLENSSSLDDDLADELIDDSPTQGSERTFLAESIADLIGRLFKVSMLAQRSHTRDRYARAEFSSGPKFADHFDIAHVTEYIKARGGAAVSLLWLLERLGKSITKRRNFILYCREHKERIAATNLPSAATTTRPMDTKQTLHSGPSGDAYLPIGTRTVFSKPSAVETSATTLIPATGVDENDFDETYASTLASSVDFKQEPHALKIPDLAEFSMPLVPFECPYCGKLQQFSNLKSWRHHVRADIRPFICTFKECGLAMFEDRRAWEDHELQRHRRHWHCQLCSAPDFGSSSSLRDHLRRDHKIAIENGQATALLDAFSRPKEQVFATDCLICDWTPELKRLNSDLENMDVVTVSTKHFMKHLAGHLEQLALFALPRIVKGDYGSNYAEDVREEEAFSRHIVGGNLFEKERKRLADFWQSDVSSLPVSLEPAPFGRLNNGQIGRSVYATG